MKLRITRNAQALRNEVVEGELAEPDSSTDIGWRPTQASLESAIKPGQRLTLLVRSDEGIGVWQSTAIVSIQPQESSWLVRTQHSVVRIEELPDNHPTCRVRRATGVIPIVTPPRG